jgi:tRNA A-37 threonylcarbamoyl transferase component Bud32
MESTRLCPKCQAPLPSGRVEGLCPQCLLQEGLRTSLAQNTSEVESAESRTLNPALGSRIRYFGDYELLEEIARGGMGVVYKARQESLNRIVALKMILSGRFASEAEVRRFQMEAESAAGLKHPNIVAIHEVGMHEGRHYFTMDYIEGKDLAAVIGRQPLPASRAARYVKTIAEAVHFAHQRGILHRDLKPQNVLIDAEDRVHITDFGLAKQVANQSSLTRSGVLMGSPSYMPPEQAKGRHDLVGPHSDVYSIGAILYEALTGRPPFTGAGGLGALLNVLEENPIPPRNLDENIPADLERICLKCLEKSPQDRYPSAADVAEEIGRFFAGDPVLAKPAGFFRKTRVWVRRHPSVVAGVVAVVVFGLAGGMVYLAEENAFLRASQSNPALKRELGRFTQPALAGMLAVSFACIVSGWLHWFLHLQSTGARSNLRTRITGRVLLGVFSAMLLGLVFLNQQVQAINLGSSGGGVSWIGGIEMAICGVLAGLWLGSLRRRTQADSGGFNEFDPSRFVPPKRVLGSGIRWVVFLIGLVMTGVACVSLVWQMRASVWENVGTLSWDAALLGLYFPIRILLMAWTDYRLSESGLPVREVPPQAVDALRVKLLEGRPDAAMALYRSAIPQADSWEAWDYVERLKVFMGKEDPEKWAAAESRPKPWTYARSAQWIVVVVCFANLVLLLQSGLGVFRLNPGILQAIHGVLLFVYGAGMVCAWKARSWLFAIQILMGLLLFESLIR